MNKVRGSWFVVHSFLGIFLALLLAAPVSASNDVTAPSLDSSSKVVEVTTKALLPPELYETPTPPASVPPVPTPEPVKIGVDRGFLLEWLQSLACSVPFFGNFCDKNLDLADGKTQEFADKSSLLIRAERPPEVQPTPLPADPNLGDGTGVTGNQTIDKIQVSLGTQPGLYTHDLPPFEDLETDCLQITQNTDNLQISTQTFDQDQRVPEIKCRQKASYRANFPKGIEPFEQNSAAGQ